MEAKLIPFKFSFTSDVVQSLSEMQQIENGQNEEMLTPEVTIEKIKLPRRATRGEEAVQNEGESDLFNGEFSEIDFPEEYSSDMFTTEEGISNDVPEFVPHFLLDGMNGFSADTIVPSVERPQPNKHPIYNCPFCKHSTTRHYNLKIHISSVHGGYKPFACTFCPYSSSERKMLRRHILCVHEQYKPFKCKDCDYAATLQSNLKKHVANVHEKNKQYKCSECPYGSVEKSKLKRHFNAVHNKSRPFTCQYCSYSANRSSTLDSHMWSVHTDQCLNQERRYKCERCPYTTTDFDLLKQHNCPLDILTNPKQNNINVS